MAPTLLKRGEAIVWLPPRTAGERALGSEPSLFVMLAGSQGSPPMVRRASLETLPPLRSVRLIFDPRDVALLSARLPQLPAARLQRALPNILEDQLLQDPAQCAWALAPGPAGAERLVGVIDRQWLETVIQAFERRSIRVTAAWPAQALQREQPVSGPVLLCAGHGVALITGNADSLGIGAGADADSRRHAVKAVFNLCGGQLKSPIGVMIQDESWAGPVREAAAECGIEPRISSLVVPTAASIDFLSARRHGALARAWAGIDARAWRWPLAGAVSALAAAIAGLNLHWFVLHQEQTALRARLDQAFFQVFPSGTAKVDPVLQLRRHVTSLRARAGQPSPDDVVPLLAALGLALGAQANDALASADYRDGRLRIRFRAGVADSRQAREGIEQAARRQGLRLQFENEREPLASVTVLR